MVSTSVQEINKQVKRMRTDSHAQSCFIYPSVASLASGRLVTMPVRNAARCYCTRTYLAGLTFRTRDTPIRLLPSGDLDRI